MGRLECLALTPTKVGKKSCLIFLKRSENAGACCYIELGVNLGMESYTHLYPHI